ncbi:MAG: class I SAM-dependent methyltransferase, partial [Psychrilyobacter sp.]|nr:class I SAM-dependent methyltransferase [Psychrilyobacter sp.]
MSINFYDANAKEFFEKTVNADMSDTCEVFTSYLKTGDDILDLGCGSGRDSLYFIKNGYNVTSVDYSYKMVEMASNFLKKEVLQLDMREMDFKNRFNGIWACASILHIKKEEVPKVLENCHNALKENGILYASFKYGDGEVERDGRLFSNFTETTVSKILETQNLFKIEKIWQTADVRFKREDEKW